VCMTLCEIGHSVPRSDMWFGAAFRRIGTGQAKEKVSMFALLGKRTTPRLNEPMALLAAVEVFGQTAPLPLANFTGQITRSDVDQWEDSSKCSTSILTATRGPSHCATISANAAAFAFADSSTSNRPMAS